jgi:hypothetical protein
MIEEKGPYRDQSKQSRALISFRKDSLCSSRVARSRQIEWFSEPGLNETPLAGVGATSRTNASQWQP